MHPPSLLHRVLVLVMVSLLALPVFSSEPSETTDADPALFVVRDEDTTVYLFGTVHVLDGKQQWFDEAVLEAFETSDELVLEMVAPDPMTMQSVVLERGMDADGPPLSKTVSPEVWKALSEELGAFGIPAASFETMDPWFAAISLAALQFMKLGLSPESGVESILQQKAGEREMKVSGLETFESQIAIFDTMPEEDQVAFLAQAVGQLAEAESFIHRMVRHWSEGDVESLSVLMNDELTDETLRKRLLDDRNANWAEQIESFLDRPGTLFVAVGAGHLGGEGSVQDALGARGIEVERIEY